MRLIVEDEQVLGRTVLGRGCGLEHLDGIDFEETVAEHLIHGEEGRGKPAAACKKLPATDA